MSFRVQVIVGVLLGLLGAVLGISADKPSEWGKLIAATAFVLTGVAIILHALWRRDVRANSDEKRP